MITAFTSEEFSLDVHSDGDSFRVLAPEVARALGFRDAFRLMESIPEAEKGYTTACTPGGDQRVGYLTEAGFYRALGQRQAARITDDAVRAQVERFQSWVYAEVLPTIRKTGGYGQAMPTGPELLARAVLEAAETIKALEATAEGQRARLQLVEPKALAFDRWLSANGSYSVAAVGKALDRAGAPDMGPGRLHRWLRENGWTYKRRGEDGIYPMQNQVETGRLVIKLGKYDNERTGEVVSTVSTRITAKGAARLACLMGVLPDDVADALNGEMAA